MFAKYGLTVIIDIGIRRILTLWPASGNKKLYLRKEVEICFR